MTALLANLVVAGFWVAFVAVARSGRDEQVSADLASMRRHEAMREALR